MGLKCAIGRQPKKSAPIIAKDGTILHDKEQQLDRWAEYYYELFSNTVPLAPATLDQVPLLPKLFELDEEPTVEDRLKAINTLNVGKAPGDDNILPEVIKQCKTTLLLPLYDLLLQCWRHTPPTIPQQLRNSKIITLYKNKGSRKDCNNYRGISLLNIVGKVYAKIIHQRLVVIADRVYSESQCGFRVGRSTIDMIFSLRQVQEKCREQNMPLHIAFIDLTKAFDLISRDALFSVLERIGCPPILIGIIKSFHEKQLGVITFNSKTSKPFLIRNGIKHGDNIAPVLFGIFFAVVLIRTFSLCPANPGIAIRTREDGGVFNQARLRAKTRTYTFNIHDLLYADDAGFLTHSPEKLQEVMDCFSKACNEFGLTISINKTKILHRGDDEPPSIKINGEELECVETFCYLGSTVNPKGTLDDEIEKRILKATVTMARLKDRVWENAKLTNKTKCQVYKACVLSILLYASETWTTYAWQERKLNTFHMRNLRRILGIKWQDKISNKEVLERAELCDIYTLLTYKRLRWFGHTIRMESHRIPKQLLYGELAEGKRSRGRPLLRYKDVCKQDLNSINIDPHTAEEMTNNRESWHHSIKSAVEMRQQKLYKHKAYLRHQRKTKEPTMSDELNDVQIVKGNANQELDSTVT
ncbi:uncharacterized protein LOC117103460 [Anneissia japonica]|uniref:uncharacterized protein LOC117103460 n=1 Tax=Anneissia japonica TaxID=1529436 RepID=UPI0014255236|nr:uncharacterized protein LOC117103460 [Anneissia japonica]